MSAARSRILIVDDEVSILRSTALLLEDMGYDVVSCAAADRILPELKAHRPDILLQDVRMPGLDLDKVVAAIRGDPTLAGTRIILFTASMDLRDVADRLGIPTILEKPFKPAEVERAIEASRPLLL